MPYKLPEPISQHIKATLPATHKMWWIRGVVLDYKIIPRPTGPLDPNEKDLLVSVGDLDAVGDGYDVRLEGTRYDLAQGDIVSLFGHEEIGATQVSYPRLVLVHNTGVFDKAFPNPAAFNYERQMGMDYKHWLAVKVPETSAFNKVGKSVLPGLLLNPTGALADSLLRGVAKKFAPKSLHDNQLPAGQEKALQDFSNYRYTDITDVYKQLVHFISAWAPDNPDAEKGFVVARRGGNTQGQLVE